MSMDIAWKEIRTEHIVADKWIDFRKTMFRLPDGAVYDSFYNFSRKNYTVVVASDGDGRYICVNQFRQGIREVTTEFPAGGIEIEDKDVYSGAECLSVEAALAAARRELLEETGYESDDWEFLLRVPADATISDNYAFLFAAKNCRRVKGQSLDETEFVNVEKHTAQEIEELIKNGGFQQAVHIAAWLLSARK